MHAERSVQLHHLGDGVGAEDFRRVGCFQRDNTLPGSPQNGRHVGQIVFAMGVVGLQRVNMTIESVDAKNINAGVDFRKVLLVWCQRFLLDDSGDFRTGRRGAQNPAIAKGIFRARRQDGHGGLLRQMKRAQPLDGLGPDEWHVAGQHQQVCRAMDKFPQALHGMAGAQLLCLRNKMHAGRCRPACSTCCA